jgi:DNA-binding response OmpR family regulator
MLPGCDEAEVRRVCACLRKSAPVLLLVDRAARAMGSPIVRGLDLGADDYLVEN